MTNWRKHAVAFCGLSCLAALTATVGVASENAPWWTLEDGRFTNTVVKYSLAVPEKWTMKPVTDPDTVTFLNMEAGAFFTVKRLEAASPVDALALSLVGGARAVFGDKLDKKPINVSLRTVGGSQAQENVWRLNDPQNPSIVRDVCIDRDPADAVVLDIIFVLPKSAKRRLDADIETVLSSFAFLSGQ